MIAGPRFDYRKSGRKSIQIIAPVAIVPSSEPSGLTALLGKRRSVSDYRSIHEHGPNWRVQPSQEKPRQWRGFFDGPVEPKRHELFGASTLVRAASFRTEEMH